MQSPNHVMSVPDVHGFLGVSLIDNIHSQNWLQITIVTLNVLIVGRLENHSAYEMTI